MIHLALPLTLVAVLTGAGAYGVVARRNAVLVLIGVELLLNAANLLLVTMGAVLPDPLRAGQVLTLFVITVAAAEIGVALAVVLALYRSRGHIDLTVAAPARDDQ
ncbi:MAG TPA: NADH-quinone oxidoreductase subunit NuoK [Dermatophilaceae bacterium]|nr:NADH-quinone oxidoreductase subunit NuoK [Dermatophilaceae bacterium]